VIRVLIVAPYAAVRAGLHALLAEAGDLAVAGEVAGGEELERLLPGARPDVLLVDSPQEEDGLLAAAEQAGAAAVLLGDERTGWQVLVGRSLPGWGYLLKDAEGDAIAAAVRAAAAGLVVLDPTLADALRPAGAAPAGDALPGEALTPREREVLQLLAQGLPNKSVALRLGISQNTVKFHVASLLAKLGAASRTEAVALGVRRGEVAL
jgi:DNA-binding NarL/FixJ family response regulator